MNLAGRGLRSRGCASQGARKFSEMVVLMTLKRRDRSGELASYVCSCAMRAPPSHRTSASNAPRAEALFCRLIMTSARDQRKFLCAPRVRRARAAAREVRNWPIQFAQPQDAMAGGRNIMARR